MWHVKKDTTSLYTRHCHVYMSLYLQMYDASYITCTHKNNIVSEIVHENFTEVWDTYWIGWRCRVCSYVERFSRQNCCIVSLWAVRWIPDDVFKYFVIWQLGKEKVTYFINVNFTEVFWDLHFTGFRISVALFVRLKCLCIDQTDTTVQ